MKKIVIEFADNDGTVLVNTLSPTTPAIAGDSEGTYTIDFTSLDENVPFAIWETGDGRMSKPVFDFSEDGLVCTSFRTEEGEHEEIITYPAAGRLTIFG